LRISQDALKQSLKNQIMVIQFYDWFKAFAGLTKYLNLEDSWTKVADFRKAADIEFEDINLNIRDIESAV